MVGPHPWREPKDGRGSPHAREHELCWETEGRRDISLHRALVRRHFPEPWEEGIPRLNHMKLPVSNHVLPAKTAKSSGQI